MQTQQCCTGGLPQIVDRLIAAAALSILSPLLIAVGIRIRKEDGGPIVYRARRVGQDGRVFRLYKFRTMRVDADRIGPGVTMRGDPRITTIGKWLRRTKVDELPQFFNVLIGDMSIVGPRPEDPRYVAWYSSEQRRVLEVRPGITSQASLTYRDEEQLLDGANWEDMYRGEILPTKLNIELDYLERRTLWSDLALILRTGLAIFR